MGVIRLRASPRALGSRRIIFAIAFTLLFAIAAGLAAGTAYTVYRLPQLRALPQHIAAERRAQGELMVPLRRIAPTLLVAIVDTEDRTFWTNIGVSFEGIFRSLIVDLAYGRFVEGGSTLTQQLVRDQLLSLQKTIPRKLEEMVLSIALTRLDSKREILDLYLNQVYLGQGAYGIAAASATYFGRTPATLSPAQCTLLAGLPQAPSYYDPLVRPQAARQRQKEVVQAMEQAGSISPQAGAALLAAPWHLR